MGLRIGDETYDAHNVSQRQFEVRHRPESTPPHAMMETQGKYSIVINLPSFNEPGIEIKVDVQKRELTVRVRRERWNSQQRYYWVFGVPLDGNLADSTAGFKRGVLEVRVPRRSQAIAV